MATSSTERVRALRERRRQALQAADAAEVALRDAGDLLEPSIRETIASLDLSGQDAAASQLALQYAKTIDRAKDQAWAMRWLAPELLRVLAELGGTPQARSKMTKKPTGPGRAVPTRIQELRATHVQAKRRYQA